MPFCVGRDPARVIAPSFGADLAPTGANGRYDMRITQAAVKSCDTNLLFEKTLFCSHRKDPLVAFVPVLFSYG